MKRRLTKKQFVMLVCHLVLIALMIVLIVSSHGFQREGPTFHSVVDVNEAMASVNGGEPRKVTLPCGFENLAPRTPVTVTAVITPHADDSVYIKTVYSPAKVYFDDELVFQFGKMENYPKYMKDPATELHMIETYGDDRPVQLRIEFLSPISRSTLMVHPFMVGSAKELIMERSRMLGIPLVFSVVQMVGGLALILISVCIAFIDKKGILYLWLGLFSLSTGCWSFGENNFSSIIFRDSTLLYMLSFMGLFTFIVPLLRFVRTAVDFENSRPLWYMELFFTASAAVALLLQFTGVMACSKSMYFFHATLPAALGVLAVLTIREAFRYKNYSAGRLMLPICVLAVSAFLELFNYQILLTYVFSSIFQMGILFFLLYMGIGAGFTVKDSIDLKNEQKELDFEKDLMGIQIKEQQSHSKLLAQHEEQLRQQRHDLRHHLEVVRELAKNENIELQDYLQTLLDNIPRASRSFCENQAVNAILAHYDTLCTRQNIRLSLRVAVPQENPSVQDSSLCIIVGNLLENAVEACGRMTEGERYIDLRSTQHCGLLVLTMDNSFNGRVVVEDGRFRSSKRSEFGIGLASVQSVAQKAGGDAEFKPEGKVFHSSVYLRL